MIVFRAQNSQPLLAISGCLLVLMGASSASAHRYEIDFPNSAPSLGNVTAATSGDTVFRVAMDGSITKQSGGGARAGGGSQLTVTVSCDNSPECNSRILRGTITSIGSPTGRAGVLTNFDIAGAGVYSESGANPRTFILPAIGKNTTKTFTVGMDFPIKGDNSGAATGDATSSFSITLVPYNQQGAAENDYAVTKVGTATAHVQRALSLQKQSDLAFGRIMRPTSGSGAVTINPTTGARTVDAGIVALPTPAASPASYTVKGEGGRTLSISVPSQVVMTRSGGGETLIVSTTNTISSPTLSGGLGSQGTYSFAVGGSVTVSSSTTAGAYSGVFNVTAAYN